MQMDGAMDMSLVDLKLAIVTQRNINNVTDYDLRVENSQTGKVYLEEEELIPRYLHLHLHLHLHLIQGHHGEGVTVADASGGEEDVAAGGARRGQGGPARRAPLQPGGHQHQRGGQARPGQGGGGGGAGGWW